VDLVMAAMTDVVSSDQHSTGRTVHAKMLKDEGIDVHGLIAGKTGTAKMTQRTRGVAVEMRNASFAGILPPERPRYLAVCILQRDDDARFYGGSYAAPPVARLLLQAQKLEQRRRLRLEPQVSVAPGVQAGPGGGPETTETGGK
jgi:cell division protein FtsI/penicillin-binding protein 2